MEPVKTTADQPMMDSTWVYISAGVRHAMGAAASAMVTYGVMASADTEKFIGGCMFVATLAWSWYQKYAHAKVADEVKYLREKMSWRNKLTPDLPPGPVNPPPRKSPMDTDPRF
jgi:hypothetical protein